MSSIFVQRQYSAVLATGRVTAVRDVAEPLWRLRDVLPKYVLKLDNLVMTTGYLLVAAATTCAFDLPANYSSSKKLNALIRVNAKAKVHLVSPTFGTSDTLLYGTNGATKGNHHGLHAFCCDVTSLSVITPAVINGGADTLVEWALWQLPDDLTAAAAWRDGNLALGVDS